MHIRIILVSNYVNKKPGAAFSKVLRKTSYLTTTITKYNYTVSYYFAELN